jgi:hypothetical protein
VSNQITDVAVLQKEILALHRQLAGARLDATNGWSRYESANKSRIAVEKLLEARALDNQTLAEDLKTTVNALKKVDGVMQILYEGGFHQQMLRHDLADRSEFEKIIGLGQTWLYLKTTRAAGAAGVAAADKNKTAETFNASV